MPSDRDTAVQRFIYLCDEIIRRIEMTPDGLGDTSQLIGKLDLEAEKLGIQPPLLRYSLDGKQVRLHVVDTPLDGNSSQLVKKASVPRWQYLVADSAPRTKSDAGKQTAMCSPRPS